MVNCPAGGRVDVDYALVEIAAAGAEVLDREIANGHLAGPAAEGVVVEVLSVDNGAGCADVPRIVAGVDLRVLAPAEGVHAGGEPVRGVALAPLDAGVVARADDDRALRRLGRARSEDLRVAADSHVVGCQRGGAILGRPGRGWLVLGAACGCGRWPEGGPA